MHYFPRRKIWRKKTENSATDIISNHWNNRLFQKLYSFALDSLTFHAIHALHLKGNYHWNIYYLRYLSLKHIIWHSGSVRDILVYLLETIYSIHILCSWKSYQHNDPWISDCREEKWFFFLLNVSYCAARMLRTQWSTFSFSFSFSKKKNVILIESDWMHFE